MKKEFILSIIIVFLFLISFVNVDANIIKKNTSRIDSIEENIRSQLIIGLNKDMDEFNYIDFLEKNNAEIIDINNELNFILIEVEDITEAVNTLSKNPNIDFVETNDMFTNCMIPDDPLLEDQWAINNINCKEAWDIEQGSNRVTVAVVDSGIDYTHEDLTNYVSLGYDWYNDDDDPRDDFSHGTHCAGIIGATINNGIGISGLAQVNLIAEKVLGSRGEGSIYSVINGIIDAVNSGADVISLSIGIPNCIESVKKACDYAYNRDVVLVASAGNDDWDYKNYPAGFDNVIAVAATNIDDEKADFSNYGSWVDVAAPGESILSTVLNDHYSYKDGTSMACPHVSGLAALILSINPDLSPHSVRYIIRNNVKPYSSSKYIGTGIIDINSAVENAGNSLGNNPIKPSTPDGEESGTVDIEYSFKTSSSDSDNDLIRYGCDWDGDRIVDEWTAWHYSSKNVEIKHCWNSVGNYKISFIAQDEKGLRSEWSNIHIIKIEYSGENLPPLKPTIVDGFSEGEKDKSYPVKVCSTDPEGKDLSYYFDWGDGSGVWTEFIESGEIMTKSHKWSSDGGFQIRVKAQDQEGATSEWSDPMSITMPKSVENKLLKFFNLENNNFISNIINFIYQKIYK